MQWSKEKRHNDLRNTTHKTKDRITRNSLNSHGSVGSSCSTWHPSSHNVNLISLLVVTNTANSNVIVRH